MPEDQYPRDHEFLSKQERLRFEEIERLARVFVSLGVRKLRLTGGEPLLRRELPELVHRLSVIPGVEDLALTTNGSLLAAQVDSLRAAGLKRLTISVDTLDPETFRALSGGRGDVETVLGAIRAAKQAGFAPIKLNCVVMRGINDGQILDLVQYAREHGHILRFIEYMDVGTCNGWQHDRMVPNAELRARIGACWPLQQLPKNYGSEVAQRYAFADSAGEVGFISSVTEPFCGDCTRARLSADGKLYTCLFARSGYDLRSVLRTNTNDTELTQLIKTIWAARDDRYSEQRHLLHHTKRDRVEMYSIGG